MAKSRSIYACTNCGAQQPRWLGRCPECGRFDSLVEEPVAVEAEAAPVRDLLGGDTPQAGDKPRALGDIDAAAVPRIPTGIPELDRVLGGGKVGSLGGGKVGSLGRGKVGSPEGAQARGASGASAEGGSGASSTSNVGRSAKGPGGGLVPGSVVLLGGEPGVGKSTLALQVAASVQGEGGAERAGRVLYVSGEESAEQIRLRADRLTPSAEAVQVLCETRVEALAEAWRGLRPKLVVVDSIQTMRTDRVESAPGSVAQVRESASLLAATAKAHDAALVLVGHVTKDGQLAGPRVLEHLVDVVLTFEGERAHAFRLLRAVKNRFGSTQEVGVFTMEEHGLSNVDNPSELFLAERSADAPGTCIVPLLEGTRPMLVELQALVAPAPYGTPRRTSIGVEDGRVALLLAVLDRRSSVDLLSRDVYVNVAGGVKIGEPASDLGVALAIASSALDCALPADVAACGEIGLGGEVRGVPRLELRVREAARLGFTRVLVPKARGSQRKNLDKVEGCRLVPVANVSEAVAWLRENGAAAPPLG